MKRAVLVLSLLVLSLSLAACKTSLESDHLFALQETKIGDNSAVGNIINQLKTQIPVQSYELQTKQRPFGLILNYQTLNHLRESQEVVLANATYLFTLINNVESVIFNFSDAHYTITKSELLELYGQDFTLITDKNELDSLIKDEINKAAFHHLFKK